MPAVYLAAVLALPAAGPEFVAHHADGTTATGALRRLGDDWSVTLGGKAPAQVAGADLLSLRRAGAVPPPFPAGPQALFANGDRLAGTLREVARERVAFAPAAADEALSLPLATLSVLWLADPDGEADPALLRRRLLAEARKQDAVVLRNGDVIEGTLTALDKEGLHVEAGARETVVERGKVAYVALNTELARSPRPKGTYARLTLADGSRLGLASAAAADGRLTGKTLTGAALDVPLERVAGLDLRQGRTVYLSDLKPKAYRHTPWSAGLAWPCAADGSVGGGDLCLGGGTYDKGLGLHAGSTVTFALGGAYQRFEARVGLDDREGKEGAVRVRVLVDGKERELGWDGGLTAKDGAKAVSLRVAGAEELTLVVERGRGGWWDQQGHVNWADARLVK